MFGWRCVYRVFVSFLVEYDLPLNSKSAQLAVQLPESALGVIPATALVDTNKDIVCSQSLGQVDNPPVPVGAQDGSIVPVQAGNVNAGRLKKRRSLGLYVSLGMGDSVVYELSLDNGPDNEGGDQLPDGGPRHELALEPRSRQGHRHGAVRFIRARTLRGLELKSADGGREPLQNLQSSKPWEIGRFEKTGRRLQSVGASTSSAEST